MPQISGIVAVCGYFFTLAQIIMTSYFKNQGIRAGENKWMIFVLYLCLLNRD